MINISAESVSGYARSHLGYVGAGIVEARFVIFCISIFIYAIFSSPTPEYIGVFEILSGSLILLSMGIRRPLLVISGLFYRGIEGQIPASKYGQGAVLFFLYGITIPFIVALINGNDIDMMIRDLVAFLFLSLPFLFGPLMVRRWAFLPILTAVIFILGFIFSVRAVYFETDSSLYLEISPAVIFCALLSIALIVSNILERKYIIFLPFFIAGIYFPFIAMADNMQRASVGFVFLYFIMIFGVALWLYPKRIWIIGAFIVMVAYYFHDYFSFLYFALEAKNSIVGLNMRVEEFLAVISSLDGNLWNILFGCGWGCSFNSPAVGGLSVNFTHNLFSFYLLKTGVLGVFLLILYLIPVVEALKRLLWYRPALALAFICVLVINITLYASFKSFEFGLVLLLIIGWGARAVQADAERQSHFFRIV